MKRRLQRAWAIAAAWTRIDRSTFAEMAATIHDLGVHGDELRRDRNRLQLVVAELQGDLAEEKLYRQLAEQRAPGSTRLAAFAEHERLVARAQEAMVEASEADVPMTQIEDLLADAAQIATRLFTEEIDRAR